MFQQSQSRPPPRARAFFKALCAAHTVRRGLGMSLFVGTILVAINQGDVILAGVMPPYWKLALTYFVPYAVSTYSSAMNEIDIPESPDP